MPLASSMPCAVSISPERISSVTDRRAAQISCLPVTRVSKKSARSVARLVGVHVRAGRDDHGCGGRRGCVACAERGRRDIRVPLGEAGLGVEDIEFEVDPDGDRGAIGRG